MTAGLIVVSTVAASTAQAQVPGATVGEFVWNEVNRNGVKDAGGEAQEVSRGELVVFIVDTQSTMNSSAPIVVDERWGSALSATW